VAGCFRALAVAFTWGYGALNERGNVNDQVSADPALCPQPLLAPLIRPVYFLHNRVEIGLLAVARTSFPREH
jgi:hypothetical protein